MDKSYDLVIVGAGLVGLTLACALGHSRFHIAVLENRPHKEIDLSDKNYDARVYAITRASENILNHIGAWAEIVNTRTSPYQKMHVWDDKGSIDFHCVDLGESNLGHIIEHRVLETALRKQLLAYSNIDLIQPIQLQQIKHTESDVEISTNQGLIKTKLVIGADGANSWLREQMNIEISKKAYGHDAIVTTVQTQDPHQKTAWQRFLSKGPLAFLPLDNINTCSIVWSMISEQADHLMAMTDSGFQVALSNAFEHRLGDIVSVTPRIKFSLYEQHAKHYVKDRVALIGDAAHTIHPLAGQGVNLGFLDAAALAEVLLEAKEEKRDFAKLHTLRKYERWRKGHNSSVMLTMSAFKKLFETQNPLIQWGRQFGLNLMNRLSPLKRQLMKYAMGSIGDLPKMAKRGAVT
ncbi:MAG: UbiH/UbiF/VisC/COQ6 family ubiquinone biosynthesis hydroxylase [Proteobacteria bacterium]|nr:UbiH/UbiF/VisC/COQ6 family ubiquinone biosynthesis hydroxylase [Pseudomonadota bacterium]